MFVIQNHVLPLRRSKIEAIWKKKNTCKVYADANDGKVYHYRDKNGLEADMIIQLADGRWAAIEVKMGSPQIEEAAASLLKLQSKVDTEKMGSPSFLMVLTAGEFAYRRNDGVLVIPLGCLKD